MGEKNKKGYQWRFFRSGGFDQVLIVRKWRPNGSKPVAATQHRAGWVKGTIKPS